MEKLQLKLEEAGYPAAHRLAGGCALEPPAAVIRETKRRYLILVLFILLNVTKSFQWICLASVTNVVAAFYRVDNMAINWTCVVFMVTFLFLALPTSWLMEHIGLRYSILIGAMGTTMGAFIKCFTCHRDGFALGMLGHLLIGFTEPFFFSAYSKVASVWFPDRQVSQATSVAILGDQVGVALGFVLPGLLVGSDERDLGAIQRGLFIMFAGVASVSLVNTVLVLFFFDEQPRYAPGYARHKQMLEEAQCKPATFALHLKRQLMLLREFLNNAHFLVLAVSFGINVGTNYSIHTLLNQMILGGDGGGAEGHARAESGLVGNLGLILILVGMPGSLMCGYLLDRFHRYKLTTALVYLFSLLAMALMTGALLAPTAAAAASTWPLYLAALPLGFLMTGYSCCGFEYAVELTYPRPELVSSTLLNISAQLFGMPISILGSAIVDAYGSVALGSFFGLVLLAGFLLSCFQRGPLLRLAAVQSARSRPPALELGAPRPAPEVASSCDAKSL